MLIRRLLEEQELELKHEVTSEELRTESGEDCF
jgi:hypothetical protein